MTYAAITGWGKCMPPAVLDNTGLASFMDTTDEWITTRTGIKERRVSHVPMTTLSHVASMRALACAGMDPKDIDLVVLGTCSADEQVPNTASAIQLLIGATKAAAMDINTACTSFLYGLSTATAMIRTGVVRNALVIGVEGITPYMDWSNRMALYTFVGVSLLGVARGRMAATERGARIWRRLHGLAYGGWALAMVHGFFSGTDSSVGWVRLICIGCGAAVLASIAYRAVSVPRGTQRDRFAGRPAPIATSGLEPTVPVRVPEGVSR